MTKVPAGSKILLEVFFQRFGPGWRHISCHQNCYRYGHPEGKHRDLQKSRRSTQLLLALPALRAFFEVKCVLPAASTCCTSLKNKYAVTALDSHPSTRSARQQNNTEPADLLNLNLRLSQAIPILFITLLREDGTTSQLAFRSLG